MARKEDEFKIPPQYRKRDISREVDLEGIYNELDEVFLTKQEEHLIRQIDEKHQDFMISYNNHLDGRNLTPQSLNKYFKAWKSTKIQKETDPYHKMLLRSMSLSSLNIFANRQLEALSQLPDDPHLAQDVIEDISQQKRHWSRVGMAAILARQVESSK